MADNDEVHASAPKGADWEVVSLTASAYAAAPGGTNPQLKHEEKDEVVDKDKVETSNPLFMSGHFLLPPKDVTEIIDQDSESVKDKANFDLAKLTELDDYQNIPFSNEKLSLSDTTLSGLNLVDKLTTSCPANPLVEKEQSIYSSATLHSLHSEEPMGAYIEDDEKRVLDESVHSSEEPKEDTHDGSGVNYVVWLKKQAVSLYAHTKETSTFWSIFAAAAVMGIVIVGQQWQHERWQVLRHELKFRIHDERMKMMTGLKDTLIGGNRRDFLVNGSTTRDR